MILVLLVGTLPPVRGEKIVLEYWDKWTGFEGAAMQDIVDDFNRSQDRIEVHYSSISTIDIKLMLAIAGRHPPDIAGVWGSSLPTYVENNALLPLDKLTGQAGIQDRDYVPSIWQVCHYHGHLWALPSTPQSVALHWNKRLFREAGLDPNRPPRTIAELEQFNEKLTQRNPDGTYRIFGHLPTEPGWWRATWGYWFGARLWDGKDLLTLRDDGGGNRRAMEWIASYPKRFGTHDVSAFLEESGGFASPLNPFIKGQVAMEIQGPWMWNFIKRYGSGDLEIGVAPFPTETGIGPPVTLVDADILTIPAGVPHVRESFEFIRYVNRQDVMEKLCTKHGKFSPRIQVSDAFWKNHPNPFIRVFYDLALSPGARPVPQLTCWLEYRNEMEQGVDDIWGGRQTPEKVLDQVQDRMQPKLDHEIKRWNILSPKLENIWSAEETLP